MVPISTAIALQNGFAFKSEDFSENGIPVIRISNIRNGTVDLTDIAFVRQANIPEQFKVSFGDVLVAMSGATTGKAGQYKSRNSSYLNQRVGKFVIKNPKLADINYISQLTMSSNFLRQLLIDAIGGAQPNISSSQIEKIRVWLPPLAEQSKIVEILTAVDQVIELAEKEISRLEDLKRGIMNDLLTKGIGHTKFKDSPIGMIPTKWDVKPMGELFNFKNGVNADKASYGSGIKFINVMEIIYNDAIRYSDIKGTVTIDESQIKTFKVNKGDVVLNRTSETFEELGMMSVYIDDAPVVFGGFVIRAQPLTKILMPQFYRYSFRERAFRNKIIAKGQGAVRANIGQEELRRIPVKIPPIHEQEAIAKLFDLVGSAHTSKRKHLVGIKNLKKALMNDLLTGKVRVKV